MTAADMLYRTVTLVRPLHRNVHRVVEARLAGTGLSVAGRAVLETLLAEPLTVPDIARKLSMKRQFVQRVAGELMAAEFVERVENPRHRTACLCRPTEKGRALFEQVHAGEQAMLERLADDLPEAEIAAALRVMRRLAEGFEVLAQGEEGK